jgi:hypothetical protein
VLRAIALPGGDQAAGVQRGCGAVDGEKDVHADFLQ